MSKWKAFVQQCKAQAERHYETAVIDDDGGALAITATCDGDVLEEGTKVSSDGILDPSGTLDKALARNRGSLPFVFGSLPRGETAECVTLAAACEAAAATVDALAASERCYAEAEAAEAEDSSDGEDGASLDELEAELRRLERDGGGGGGSGMKKKKARR